MNRLRCVSRRTEHGFTLVELLIVLSVVGILANLSVPVYEHARKKAQVARILGDFQAVRRASTEYFIKNSSWPAEAGAGTEPPELQAALARSVTWDGRYAYDWENLIGPDNQSLQPESGVRVGFSIRTRDEEILQLIRDSQVAPVAETWGWGITLVIEGVNTASSGAGGGNASGGGSSGDGGTGSGGSGSSDGGGGNGRGRGRGSSQNPGRGRGPGD
jgi:prepilin-type N-terminal cleavage/methylation domain-containing protein